MYTRPRTLQDKTVVWDFWYYDSTTKKNKKLHRKEIPSHINSKESAEQFCDDMAAKFESATYRIAQKLKWREKHHKWDRLFKAYIPACKRRAPNSWGNSLYYLEQYVMPFFTERENNAHLWSDHYDAFKLWLLSPKVKAKRRKKGDKVSYSTANNCISSMNAFLTWMKQAKKMGDFEKCPKFPTDMINVRGLEDVLTPDEVKVIGLRFQSVKDESESYEYFTTLLNTGLRMREGLGLSMFNFYPGEPENETFKKMLKKHNLSCFGYIFINSQAAKRSELRNKKTKEVYRKPLKGRRKIEDDKGRLIPILDKDTFNILGRRYNAALKLYEAKAFGKDEKNYLLFEKYNYNTFSNLMAKMYDNSDFRKKTPHCLRHTFSTYFVGDKALGDFALCRLVLGHRSSDTTEMYVHIFEAISRAAVGAKARKAGGIKLIE